MLEYSCIFLWLCGKDSKPCAAVHWNEVKRMSASEGWIAWFLRFTAKSRPEKALKIKEVLENYHKFEEVHIMEVGPSMGVYTSEGAVLVAVI